MAHVTASVKLNVTSIFFRSGSLNKDQRVSCSSGDDTAQCQIIAVMIQRDAEDVHEKEILNEA